MEGQSFAGILMLGAAVAAAHLFIFIFRSRVIYHRKEFSDEEQQKKLHFIGDWVLADSRNMSPLRLYLAASTTTTTNNRIFPERASDDDDDDDNDNNYNYYFHFVLKVSNAICLASAPWFIYFHGKNAKYFTFEFFRLLYSGCERRTHGSFSAEWPASTCLVE